MATIESLKARINILQQRELAGNATNQHIIAKLKRKIRALENKESNS